MQSEIKEFFEALNHIEQPIADFLFKDDIGILIKAAFCELDISHSGGSNGDQSPARAFELAKLRFGAARMANIILQKGPAFKARGVTFRREATYSQIARRALLTLGSVQYGRQFAQSAMAGRSEIRRTGSNSFEITFDSSKLPTCELESSVLSRYTQEYDQRIGEAMRRPIFKRLRKQIDKAFHENVRVFENHFITYDTTPLLDYHFFGISYQLLQRFEGFDSFHFRLKFGGIEFQSYKIALTFLLSCALKHEAFCDALVRKNAKIRTVDILTVTLDCAPFVEEIFNAVNEFGAQFEEFTPISLQQAKTIFNVLSCNRASAKKIEAPGSPLPPLIQTTEETFIRSLVGTWAEPTRFLIESLKFHFEQDFAKNQTTREDSLRRAAIRILSGDIPNLEFRENIKIRHAGRIKTDIDLVVFEEASGTAILCQLKHQDSFGADIGGEISRTRRLKDEVGYWLNVVHEWVESDVDQLRSALRLKAAAPLNEIFTLTLTRHFAHPLQGICSGAADAYCNFPQLVDSARAANGGLKTLIQKLKQIPQAQEQMRSARPAFDKWVIDGLEFTVRDTAAT